MNYLAWSRHFRCLPGQGDLPVLPFVRALLGLCLILLPEYAICVLAVGAVRGWLLTLTQPAHHGMLTVALAAVV